MMLTWRGSRGKKEKKKRRDIKCGFQEEILNWTWDEMKEFRKGWPQWKMLQNEMVQPG